jgi:hypothetical protein
VTRLRAALFSGLLLFVAAAAMASAAPTPRSVARARALAAYSAMQRSLYSAATHSYAGSYGSRTRAQAWPFSQALWAAVELAAMPGMGGDARADLYERIRSLAAYSRPEPGRPSEFAPVYGGSGRVYYDDNLWIALGLLAAARVTGDGTAVTSARQIFTLVGDGWDTNAAHPCPGGVFWTRGGANHDRNTVTTANAALLALVLYARDHTPSYLTWARAAYAWTHRCLGTANGLVRDHIDLAGDVDATTWSYNQGAMVAAGVRLYRATSDRRYLEDARKTASAALAALRDPLALGEPPFFLAIFYRDLLELDRVAPDARYRAAMQAFADEAWTKARDPRTGLFRFGGRVPTLLDEAAMVQIYATLAR